MSLIHGSVNAIDNSIFLDYQLLVCSFCSRQLHNCVILALPLPSFSFDVLSLVMDWFSFCSDSPTTVTPNRSRKWESWMDDDIFLARWETVRTSWCLPHSQKCCILLFFSWHTKFHVKALSKYFHHFYFLITHSMTRFIHFVPMIRVLLPRSLRNKNPMLINNNWRAATDFVLFLHHSVKGLRFWSTRQYLELSTSTCWAFVLTKHGGKK